MREDPITAAALIWQARDMAVAARRQAEAQERIADALECIQDQGEFITVATTPEV